MGGDLQKHIQIPPVESLLADSIFCGWHEVKFSLKSLFLLFPPLISMNEHSLFSSCELPTQDLLLVFCELFEGFCCSQNPIISFKRTVQTPQKIQNFRWVFYFQMVIPDLAPLSGCDGSRGISLVMKRLKLSFNKKFQLVFNIQHNNLYP